MADGELSRRRRSQRLIKLKETSCKSEASRMIKLKEEWRALLDRKMDRIETNRKALDVRKKAIAERVKARLAGDPIPPPPPCRPLSPPPCDLVAPPPPAGTNKKKKKVVKRKVPQECINHMILNLRAPYNDGYPLERLRKRTQRFREFYAELRALDEKRFEYRQAIIKQFRQKGYAEDYSEIDDDED